MEFMLSPQLRRRKSKRKLFPRECIEGRQRWWNFASCNSAGPISNNAWLGLKRHSGRRAEPTTHVARLFWEVLLSQPSSQAPLMPQPYGSFWPNMPVSATGVYLMVLLWRPIAKNHSREIVRPEGIAAHLRDLRRLSAWREAAEQSDRADGHSSFGNSERVLWSVGKRKGVTSLKPPPCPLAEPRTAVTNWLSPTALLPPSGCTF